MLRFPLIFVLILCATVSFGQSKKKRSKKSAPTQQQGNSLGPYFPAENYEPEKKGNAKKSKSRKPTHNAVEEFYERQELVAKARKKAEKESMKPQYSDPMYFGHKRKPKKRPPGKMKFCKECEIRH